MRGFEYIDIEEIETMPRKPAKKTTRTLGRGIKEKGKGGRKSRRDKMIDSMSYKKPTVRRGASRKS